MANEQSWRGAWVASRYSDYKHAARQHSRVTVCGIRFATMTEDRVRHQPPCPRCQAAIAKGAAA